MAGAAFILIYLVFLVLLGLPILVSEFAVGRSSRLSTARAFHKLEPEGSNFHKYSYMGMIGNYMLMMFYTMVAGWMMYYGYVMATGKLSGASSDEVSGFFSNLMTSTGTMTGWMIVAVLLAFGVCSLGLQNGIERITKIMMICLLALIVVCCSFCNAGRSEEDCKFYHYTKPRQYPCGRSWKRDLWCAVTGILYFEYRYRCDGDLRKLYGKGMYPCRRKY